MPLKLIKPTPAIARYIWAAAMIVAVVAGWFAARGFFLDTLAERLDVDQPGAGIVVDGLVGAAPWDPGAHLRAAVYYDKTFDEADLERSLIEYQRAAELSPNNYWLWLDLARARSRNDDAAGAEEAFKRATALAPNYADVQWAYGNFLIRQGRDDEGFPLIAKSAAEDPKLAGPGVAILLQMTGGDVNRTQQLLGNDPAVNSALAVTLASLKQYDEALQAWERIPLEVRRDKYRPIGATLINSFAEGGKFRAAAAVATDLADADAAKPTIGAVMNGDFENGVKLRNAGFFEWQIADGAEPQIGLSETQHHSGRYGLTVAFSTFRPEGFRDINQVVAVEPGARYRMAVWYKSSLKTDAKFKWQISDAATGALIASTDELSPAADWVATSVSFTVPR